MPAPVPLPVAVPPVLPAPWPDMVPPALPLIEPSLPVELDPLDMPEPVEPLMLAEADEPDELDPRRVRDPRWARVLPRPVVPVLEPMPESVPIEPVEDWPLPIDPLVD